MSLALFRSLWSDSIYKRLYAIFNLYMIIEVLLTVLHDEGIINLSFYHALIIRRKKLASTLYHTIYLPLNPLLIAIYWGFIMRCAMIPGFWRFGSLTVTIVVLGVVWSGCGEAASPLAKSGHGDPVFLQTAVLRQTVTIPRIRLRL
jgi:hypothetical protein